MHLSSNIYIYINIADYVYNLVILSVFQLMYNVVCLWEEQKLHKQNSQKKIFGPQIN